MIRMQIFKIFCERHNDLITCKVKSQVDLKKEKERKTLPFCWKLDILPTIHYISIVNISEKVDENKENILI